MNVERIKKELETFDIVEFVGPQNSETIFLAEKALGVCFPPDYRIFLSEFGCGGVDSEDLIGLGGEDHLHIVKLTSILRGRQHALPENLLPIRSDGFGNYDCINIAQPTTNGEFAIVQWNREADVDQMYEVLASSYSDWLALILKLIKENS